MTLRQLVVLRHVEAEADGTLRAELQRQVVNGDAVLNSTGHRVTLTPGDKIDARIAEVNAHLAHEGWPPIGDAAVDQIRKFVKVAHTREAVGFHRERQRQAVEEEMARRKRAESPANLAPPG